MTARYVVLPHEGAFNEQDAHRFGMEQSMPLVAQSRYEYPRTDAFLPRNAGLLTLPESPVLTLRVLPDGQDGVLIRLLNASDSPQLAVIGSQLLKIAAANICDVFGQATGELSVTNGSVSVEIEARRVCVVRLGVQTSN